LKRKYWREHSYRYKFNRSCCAEWDIFLQYKKAQQSPNGGSNPRLVRSTKEFVKSVRVFEPAGFRPHRTQQSSSAHSNRLLAIINMRQSIVMRSSFTRAANEDILNQKHDKWHCVNVYSTASMTTVMTKDIFLKWK
jgi:hypothetical protein